MGELPPDAVCCPVPLGAWPLVLGGRLTVMVGLDGGGEGIGRADPGGLGDRAVRDTCSGPLGKDPGTVLVGPAARAATRGRPTRSSETTSRIADRDLSRPDRN